MILWKERMQNVKARKGYEGFRTVPYWAGEIPRADFAHIPTMTGLRERSFRPNTEHCFFVV